MSQAPEWPKATTSQSSIAPDTDYLRLNQKSQPAPGRTDRVLGSERENLMEKVRLNHIENLEYLEGKPRPYRGFLIHRDPNGFHAHRITTEDGSPAPGVLGESAWTSIPEAQKAIDLHLEKQTNQTK